MGPIALTADLAQKSIRQAVRNPQMIAAALALYDGRLHEAEPLLKARLKQNPFDVAAIRMLAELAGRIGRTSDAENLLRRAIELAPAFAPARSNLALLLYRQGRHVESIAELDQLLGDRDDDYAAANLKAAAASRIGEYGDAVQLYERVLAHNPASEKIWHSYGHVLRTIGRLDESVAAYRKALAIRPGFGESWWSLANLKTVRFGDDDVAAMQVQLAHDDLTDDDRVHIDFALGKAFEDAKNWPASFAHYSAANRRHRATLDYDAAEQSALVDSHVALFASGLFDVAGPGGTDAPDPIFILGMPRAGSTLVEQILASHSAIEGTQELHDIGMMSQRLATRVAGSDAPGYPDVLAQLTPDVRRRLGDEYLERTQIYRKTDRPLFVDKMPNNWMHVGLIHLILPNAKIIDARRHPLDCCFSNFKQRYARGQSFSYDLTDVGHYYADYVRYMDAVDAALPGRVHRVIHEHLVADPETEIRALLGYLGVPFEENCLRFWQNDRAVQTPSAEQVRRPINRDGMDRWRHYGEWLRPLENALGVIIEAYPQVAAPLPIEHL